MLLLSSSPKSFPYYQVKSFPLDSTEKKQHIDEPHPFESMLGDLANRNISLELRTSTFVYRFLQHYEPTKGVYIKKNNADLAKQLELALPSPHSLYIHSCVGRSIVLISLKCKMHKEFELNNGRDSKNYKDVLLIFNRSIKLENAFYVFASSTRITNEKIQRHMFHRIQIMDEINACPQTPKTHYVFERTSKKTQKLKLIQELTDCDLFDYLNLDEPIPFLSQLQIIEDLFRATLFFHEHNIIHRDIKIENALITRSASSTKAYLTDVDLACHNDGKEGVSSELVGTYENLCPETIKAFLTNPPIIANFSGDIWGLGLIAYELFHQKEQEFCSILKVASDLDNKCAADAKLREEELSRLKSLKLQVRSSPPANISHINMQINECKQKIEDAKERYSLNYNKIRSILQQGLDCINIIPPAPTEINTLDDLSQAALQPDPSKRITVSQGLETILQLKERHTRV